MKQAAQARKWMLVLIVCLPLASVAFGGVMFYFALNTSDSNVMADGAPMSKVSWRSSEAQQQ